MSFLQAAYDRDYVGMEEALDYGNAKTLYTKDPYGNTAMHYAVYCSNTKPDGWYCHRQQCNKSVDRERDPDAQKMVQFLLKKEQQIEDKIRKFDLVNEHNDSGWAPLIFATEGNLMNTVVDLLDAGANIDTTPCDGLEGAGDTPLKNSIWHCNYKITKLLLSKGAKVNILPSLSGGSVLRYACSRDLPEIAKTIIKRDEITPEFLSLTTEDGDSPLSFALAYGRSEVVELLLSHGASLYIPKNQSSQKKDAISTEMQLLNIDPKTLTKFFDGHITSMIRGSDSKDGNQHQQRDIYKLEDTELKFDYKCMKPVYKTVDNFIQIEEKKDRHRRHPLNLPPKYEIHTETKLLEDIVSLSQNHKKILKHPLSRALLMRKWNKIKNYYWGWIISYLLFLICLLALAKTHGPFLHNGMKRMKNNTSTTTINNSTYPNTLAVTHGLLLHNSMKQLNKSTRINNSTDANASSYKEHTRIITLISFTILLVFMFIVELLQIGVSLWYWGKEVKNYFQLIIIALGLFLVYDLFQEDQNFVLDLHLIGLLIPMVFYGLLHEFGYHPAFAKYILLLDKVCRTLARHGVVYIGLVIMPAISFYLIIGDKDDTFSDDFSKLFAKTFVMFVGEVELFPLSSNATFKWFEIGFFLFFIFFLVVVLMNLLNALAIMDTKELLEDVEMEMLYSLLETVAFWENLKKNDPHNKFKWSLLKKINNLINIFKIVPSSSMLNGDDPETEYECNMKLYPYQSTDTKKQKDKIGKEQMEQKIGKEQIDQKMGKDQIDQIFGVMNESIITSAFVIINNRQEEEENSIKKEQEKCEKEYERMRKIELEILVNEINTHRKEEEERCRKKEQEREKKEQEREEKEAKLERLVNEIHSHLGL